MDLTKKTIITAFLIILVYIVIINLLFLFKESYNNLQPNSSISGLNTKISVSSSLSVLIIGNRWYGKIVTEDNFQSIYLFGIIKIPWKYYSLDIVWIHLFFIVILIETLILLNQKWRLKNEKMGQSFFDSTN